MTAIGSPRKLNLLYVAYPLLPVSDESCGGAEQMLAAVEAQISRRGHSTMIAACRGSRARGELLITGPEATEPDGFARRDVEHCARVLESIRANRELDLVHDASGSFWQHAAAAEIPVLATLHLPRTFYPSADFENIPPNLFFNCVSDSQARSFDGVKGVIAVVRNGIDVGRCPFTANKQDYLLWLGRICEEKGPHLAIEVARRAGLPLVLAGQVYPFTYHRQFYAREIRPWLGGERPRVCFIETPTLALKHRLLSQARAVLIPSLVDETSSLVAMEAMACGTPVVGFRRGAIPEIVVERQTGFLVDNVEQMAEAVWSCGEINPHACRAHVKTNYSVERMASEYEALYRFVLQTRSTAVGMPAA